MNFYWEIRRALQLRAKIKNIDNKICDVREDTISHAILPEISPLGLNDRG